MKERENMILLGADESYEISKEDIEAFNMKKKVFKDPMANYKEEN